MKILVSGGAGFIGSHLVDSLVNDHQVLVVDDLSTGKQEFVNKQAEFVKLDIRDAKLKKIVSKFKPDVVYHLAAQKNVRISLENPLLDTEINIIGALNLLQACLDNSVTKFIFISTGGIYGDTDDLPTKETGEEIPLSPYILNKLTFEKYLKILAEDKLKWTVLRPANVYGPRQDPHGEAGVISIFLNNIIDNKTLLVNGDGRQTRDFIYVDDVVQACLQAIDAKQEIYNIGTAKETSLLDLIDQMKQVVNKEVEVKHQDAIVGEVIRSVLDNTKAKQELKWQAKYDLKKGLELTFEYFKK